MSDYNPYGKHFSSGNRCRSVEHPGEDGKRRRNLLLSEETTNANAGEERVARPEEVLDLEGRNPEGTQRPLRCSIGSTDSLCWREATTWSGPEGYRYAICEELWYNRDVDEDGGLQSMKRRPTL